MKPQPSSRIPVQPTSAPDLDPDVSEEEIRAARLKYRHEDANARFAAALEGAIGKPPGPAAERPAAARGKKKKR